MVLAKGLLLLTMVFIVYHLYLMGLGANSASASARVGVALDPSLLISSFTMEQQRAARIASHLSAAPTAAVDQGEDIVVVYSQRTAIGKAKRGSLRNTGPDDMLVPLFKDLLKKTNVNPLDIGDIVIGTVLPPGGKGATQVRIASLLAGMPIEVPCSTVNRQCSSGLQAIANVAGQIKAGYYDIGIAGGVESMSSNSMGWQGDINQKALEHEYAKGCYLPMGQTSENVAERYGISREKQDQMAVASHARAAAAQKSGRFDAEIVAFETEVTDPKSGETKTVVVSKDEGIRPQTTMESLAKLKAVFRENGSTTAGNASQLSDGAAVALLTKRSVAERLNLPILAVFRGFAVAGVEPSVMGIGPAVAIPAAVRNAGLSMSDIDLFEINEAFASQATYCVEKLGINPDLVNVNGGAIALGHPLGCTGARMTATLIHEMHKRKARYGVVSMCIGSGMGACGIYEVEQ